MTYDPPVSPYAAGISGKCPRCGQGALFDGYLGLRNACDVCGLDYAKADAGDGPAVFVIFIVGFVATAVAFILRFGLHAPMWLALGVSAGITVVLTLVLLRPLKATLIALQYQNKAAEGRLAE
jgi:uncharacterized protein (DUF983 family)